GAAIQLAGEAGRQGRQIAANTIDISLAPDGATPTALVGRDAVQVTFPPEEGTGARTIHATAMDARGEGGRGLTRARFTGNVEYREDAFPARPEPVEGRARGSTSSPRADARSAKSNSLDAAVKPGMSAIEEAKFAGAVRFEDGSLSARAAAARYLIE